VLAQELHVVSSNEPGSFEEAEQNTCWRRAMLEEMKAIVDNGTWFPEELSIGRHVIGLKWVLKVKRDEYGNIVRHEASWS
jgi:hypothetical protein